MLIINLHQNPGSKSSLLRGCVIVKNALVKDLVLF